MKNKNLFTYSAIAGIVVVALLALWQSADAPTIGSPQAETPVINTSNSYIGLSLDNATKLAEEKGEMFRVVEIDGKPQMATMDYRIGRINASTVGGIVSGFYVEGSK